MDRWKAEVEQKNREEKSRREKSRREKIREEKQRRERVRRKKMQVREKVGKSRNIVFFQWFVAPEGRKGGSLKRRVRSIWPDMKNCAKHISKSKCTKHTSSGPLFEVAMSKKCTPLWREAHFKVKMLKTQHVGATFGRSDVVSRGRRKGLWTLSKASKTWGFCSISKKDGRRGGRGSTRDMFIRAVRQSGHWFPDRGCLRWFCVTGAALCMTWHHFFVAGAVV